MVLLMQVHACSIKVWVWMRLHDWAIVVNSGCVGYIG